MYAGQMFDPMINQNNQFNNINQPYNVNNFNNQNLTSQLNFNNANPQMFNRFG